MDVPGTGGCLQKQAVRRGGQVVLAPTRSTRWTVAVSRAREVEGVEKEVKEEKGKIIHMETTTVTNGERRAGVWTWLRISWRARASEKFYALHLSENT